MKTECPYCGQHYDVDNGYNGQIVECETCGRNFIIDKKTDFEKVPEDNNTRYADRMQNKVATIQRDEPGGKMKALVCEMCGSTDLVKENGLFVCQSCGIKYSLEEARKMMIEGTVNVSGTVKVDKTENVEKMIKRISVLMSQSNWDEANGLCKRALEIDPENAELYLLLCMIEHKVPDEKTLRTAQSFLLSWDNNFKAAKKFASSERIKELKSIENEQYENYKKWKEKKKQAEQKENNIQMGCGIAFVVVVGIILGLLSSC